MITIFTWWCWKKKRTGRYHSEWKSLTYNVDNSMTDSQFFFVFFRCLLKLGTFDSPLFAQLHIYTTTTGKQMKKNKRQTSGVNFTMIEQKELYINQNN